MVIGDFNFHGSLSGPDEAHAPLVVYANAVLTLPVTAQCFQAVGRRDPEVTQGCCHHHSLQSHSCPALYIGRETPDRLTGEEAFGVLISEPVRLRG